jgi:O-acetyl-ADP-ribose deacetylase (regulator of RNase III)
VDTGGFSTSSRPRFTSRTDTDLAPQLARACKSGNLSKSTGVVMIEQGVGDLLACEVDALVNAVNTVGVMGKGLALQFKKAFPDNFKAYERACASGQVVVGRMFVVERSAPPRFIINFPTKADWRQPSKLEYISAGLADLAGVVSRLGIRSLAMPALGCGLGGLDWAHVRPLIENTFGQDPQVRVVLFAPK